MRTLITGLISVATTLALALAQPAGTPTAALEPATALPPAGDPTVDLQTNARFALLMDFETGNVLFSKDGDQPLSCQWSFNGTNLLGGATNATLTLPNAQPVHTGSYSVQVNNSFGTVTSAPATLTVLVPPAILSQPASLIVTQAPSRRRPPQPLGPKRRLNQ